MKKGDYILIILLIGMAMGLSWQLGLGDKSGFSQVQIVQDGKVIESYVIDEDFYKLVEISRNGEENVIEISEGSVKMLSANCPDKLCMHSHPISKNGEMIVCLPHRVYVRIVSAQEDPVDIVEN